MNQVLSNQYDHSRMGYTFRELYLTGRPPVIRWRGEVAETYYKEGKKFYHIWDRKQMRKAFFAKKIALPATITFVCVFTGYMIMKGQGMLHVLQNPRDGVKEYYNHTVGRHLDSHFKDERAMRQREAYRKALEKKETLIMEQFKKYEEKES